MGELVAPECDAPTGGLFIMPADVEALERRIDVHMESTNDTVAHCAGLSTAEVENWHRFYAAWKKEIGTPVALFGTGKRWDTACAFSRELSGTRDKLKQQCALVGPEDLPQQKGLDLSALKWVAAAVIVVGVGYGIRSVVIATR
jgi:hypothetical protein